MTPPDGERAPAGPPPAILTLGARAAGPARRLRDALPGAERWAPPSAPCEAEVRYGGTAAEAARELFAAGRPILGLCAAGILIRALAPLLADKAMEPPVLAVAEDGSAVVPLLGGHRGANALARRAGRALGVAPAITTASDRLLGVALDDPPPGWRLGAGAAAAHGPFAARLLAGEPVRLRVDAGDAAWLRGASLRLAADGGAAAALELRVTHAAAPSGPGRLVLHPPALALGVGAERGAPPEAMLELARALLAEAGLAPGAVACVASIDLKADEPAVHALAAALGVPARFLPAADLLRETDRLTARSPAVMAATGCWGVAEGAALAAAGPAGRLLVPKRIGRGVTAAVALAPAGIDAEGIGRPRGRLAIVGLGPGDPSGRTRAAEAAIREAGHAVGYGLYLDLAADLLAGKALHPFPLGAEEARCAHALDLAAGGASVALLASGDPGIYAMASPALELLDRAGRPDWARVEVRVIPGVSAMQAASAAAGAPLGHDFCAISLSDLLTPWEAIERRLEAAAAGDFVVALYNPVSARRREGLARAREILLHRRAPGTPVLLARELGRPGHSLRATSLAALEPGDADMLTTVLVGSSRTRAVAGRAGAGPRLYTPRGYRLP